MPTAIQSNHSSSLFVGGIQHLSAQISSQEVAYAAESILLARGHEYAKASAPRSPHPELSGNKIPMQSTLGWLAGRAKCNQFVGDALFTAGFEMPTFRMQDGTKHYMNAERLPKQHLFFERITNSLAVQPGDLLVLDYYRRSGENGAHVEIVHSVDPISQTLITLSALGDGVAARERRGDLIGPSAPDGSWNTAEARIYLLRPVKLLR